MKTIKHQIIISALFSALLISFCVSVNAQNKTSFEVLTDEALTKVVPTSFYFAGQSAQTQARNTAAAKLGKDRFVVVGLVDTSGYSTEISGKYEGFFITDSPVKIGNKQLNRTNGREGAINPHRRVYFLIIYFRFYFWIRQLYAILLVN